ncbi:PDR/VanB family oxidoreductase [Prescottella equi]|uniref:PDR/VanB family oxidoreductase n=1 Tax=Rhodococcus hoagii TaxID=43767 RepID=UPI000D0EC2C0|nr:PDR/VanB family oxidoreductase [Prescottella equi]AVP71420.1 oxidoreductase [Prescottella equi]MCD7052773.1 PDR/VanB family oxidoreductase [Rhodococcus sp. BH2-1]
MTMIPDSDLLLHLRSRRICADGVIELELVDPRGDALPAWAPGAHIDLVLRDGLTRQYSLCGDPANRTAWHIAVLLDPAGRGGSQHVHEHLIEGATVRVRGPRNHFALRPAEHYLFIAGGIGITPLLPMVAAVHAAGADWTMFYGGRTRASMAYAEHLVERYGTRVTLVPQDEQGLLDLDSILARPRPGTEMYCCGPATLLDAVRTRCTNWLPDRIHTESFTPLADEMAGDDVDFEIEIASDGSVLTVPANQSILDVLLNRGIDVLSSCGEGTCGSCETPVLSGVIDHRDTVLEPSERAANDRLMICVSRAACQRLVLDL